MCAHRKASLDDYFTNSTIIPGGESRDFEMSKKQFQRMHKKFHFYIKSKNCKIAE